MIKIKYNDYLLYKKSTEYKIESHLQEENENYELITEENKIDKVHDKLFRDILSNKKEFASFINTFIDIGEKIKPEDIELYKRSYITKQYKEKISDIVYKVKDKNIYFLVEHQTKVDKFMLKRIWNYIDCLLEYIMKTYDLKKEEEYPQIIPIVLYTGVGKWTAKKNLKISGKNVGYNLIDINEYSKEFLISKNTILTNAMLIEKSKSLEEMVETIEEIIKGLKENQKGEMIRIIDKIVRQKMNNNKVVEELLQQIKKKEVVGMTPLMYGVLQERKNLTEEGIRKGIRTEKRNIVKNMIKSKLKKDLILKMTEISEEEYEKIKKEVYKNKI